ncbi:hypothetical protein HY641_04585 [Candidatus Woesearchaeota archaeon]|nr:hypothetical protein [Candidatus Woesearchaeota archaeon]
MGWEESLEDAKEEFKRADHLMYVSLKYTRTVDVIKSIVERLMNTYDFGMEVLLHLKNVSNIPKIPKLRVEAVKKEYASHEHGDVIKNYLNLYLLLRVIDKANFDRSLEFRRHVTMTAHLEDKDVEISIDIIEDYFTRVKEFLNFVEQLAIHNE